MSKVGELHFHDDEWEYSYDNFGHLAEMWSEAFDPDRPETPVRVGVLRREPYRWAALVVLSRDSDGEPEGVEWRLFDSEPEAEAAHLKDARGAK